MGINESGQVVGWSQGQFGIVRAFLWDRGAVTDLGSLSDPAGFPGSSRAKSINDQAQIVGLSTLPGGERRAFLWSEGVMTDLGSVGSSWSEAIAINERGFVAGGILAFGPFRALLWKPK